MHWNMVPRGKSPWRMPGTPSVRLFLLRHATPGALPANTCNKTTEVIERVSNHIKADPEIYHNISYLIEGWGWDHTRWRVERWPTTVCLISDPR